MLLAMREKDTTLLPLFSSFFVSSLGLITVSVNSIHGMTPPISFGGNPSSSLGVRATGQRNWESRHQSKN